MTGFWKRFFGLKQEDTSDEPRLSEGGAFEHYAHVITGEPTITDPPVGVNVTSTEYIVKIGPDGKLLQPFEGASISPEGAKFFVGIDFAKDSDSTVIAKSRRGQIDWAMVKDGELPWVSQEPTWDDNGCTGTIGGGCPGLDKCEKIQEERCNRDTEVWEGGLCNSLECPFATLSPGEPGEVLRADGIEPKWSKLMEDDPWYPENLEPTWAPETDAKGNFIWTGTGAWKPTDKFLMIQAIDEFLGGIKETKHIYDLEYPLGDIGSWKPIAGQNRGIIDWGDAENISWKGKDGARYSITETDHSSIVKPTSDVYGAFSIGLIRN